MRPSLLDTPDAVIVVRILQASKALRQNPVLGYAAAFAAMGLATSIQWLARDQYAGAPFLTIYPAIILTTLIGGLGPGFLSAILAGVSQWSLFIPIRHVLALSSYAFDATICVMVIVFINRTLDLLLSSIEREKLAKQHQHLLAGELHHRIQNLFTVIQAVIRFSLPGDAMIEESAIRHRLLDRLQSMSTANRSITDSMGGVQLLDIINNEIRGIESQFEISGAGGLVLGAQITQNFALILHELITNALKYGALSVPGGRVSLRFNRTASGVTLTWQERDGPPVLPPTRTSFGSRILGAFAKGFCENVDASYAPSGFRYSLDVRLDELNGSEPTLLAATLASDSIVPAATNESDLCTFLSWLDNERRAVVPDGNRGGKPLSTGSTARPGSTLPSPPNLV